MISAIIILLVLFVLLSKRIFQKFTLYKKVKGFFIGMKDGFKSIGLENKAAFWIHTLLIWVMYLMMTYMFLLDRSY